VVVNGPLNICPQIDGLSASPAEVVVGSSIALTASGHDTDAGPSALSYAWTATSGTFANAAAATTSFTCTAAGPATLTLALSDGDPAASCADHLSVTVTCTAQPSISQLGHVVVIYLENWSFDSLYGSFPGAEGLSSPNAHVPQIDNATGLPFVTLPQVDPNIPLGLPNASFDISQFVPATQLIHDLVHRFYQEQAQIDGGKMDKFVTVSDAKGLSLGYYPTGPLPMVQLAGAGHRARSLLPCGLRRFVPEPPVVDLRAVAGIPERARRDHRHAGSDGEPGHRRSGDAGRLRRQHLVHGQ
jgi:hypothetical protein